MPRPKNPTLPRKVVESSSPPMKTRGVFANVKLEPVPFDPAVDCPPYACFNCRIKDDHLNKDCSKPVLHKYCENCGRRGLYVYDCPRCSKGYIEQFGDRSYAHVVVQQPVVEVPQKVERKLPVGMTPLPKSTKKKRTKKISSSSSQTSIEKNVAMKTHNSHSTSDSTVESELGDKSFDDVEDLDNMIFDEDLDSTVFYEGETSPLQQQNTNETAEAIMTLIEATKDLSLEVQNKVLLEFIQAQNLAIRS